MSTITFLRGDATKPDCPGYKIIVHCVNTLGRWGSGFVISISKRWKEPKQCYTEWYNDNGWFQTSRNIIPFQQGQIQIVKVEHDIAVCNLIGQSGIGAFPPRCSELPPVRYGAIHEGLIRLREYINDNVTDPSIHMPRMGCDRAGGEWRNIEDIINIVFFGIDIPIFVYDWKNPEIGT
jgi:hypothetical protein